MTISRASNRCCLFILSNMIKRMPNKIRPKPVYKGLLAYKKGTISYFIYSLGDTLNISLKQVEKYLGLLNPTE